MAKDIMDVYRDILNMDTPFDDSRTFDPMFGISSYDADDSETFMTSEEIVKAEEAQKEVGGISKHGNNDIEEHVGHFKRYTKRRQHKYTEKEMEEIRESCKYTIVHDYSEHDEYHMSDEERHENDSLKEIAAKLATLKRTYRKVNQYIRAMRIVVEAWEILERKENFIHDEDEFFTLVAEGKIYHNRIIMPKLANAKKYDIDTIIKYISNPELDPDDLMPIDIAQDDDDWYKDDEDLEAEMERLLSPDEVQYIIDHADNPEMMYIKPLKKKFIKGYDQRVSTKKKIKKSKQYQIESTHALLRKIQSDPRNHSGDGMYGSRYQLLTHSLFDIEEEEKDFWDDLRYDGSWTDEDGLYLYDLMVNEEMMKQRIPGSSYRTYGDEALTKFFKTMEDQGMNVVKLRQRMNMTSESEILNEQRRSKKESKRIEAQIIDRITKLNKSDKFKKAIAKAEKKLNKSFEDD